MKYKAIGFDYGGVIHGLPGKIFDQKIAELLGVGIKRYREAYFTHNKKHIDTQEMWQMVLSDLQKQHFSDKIDQFTKEWSKQKVIQLDMMDLVERLKRNGYKVGLLTNRSKEQAIKLRGSEIVEVFDTVCISAEIGYAKPELEAFRIFCDQLGVGSQELVFIDDEFNSLSTSGKVGYTPILFESYVQLLETLADLDIVEKVT